MDQVEKLLRSNHLVQVDTPEDAYFLGSCEDLVQLSGVLCEQDYKVFKTRPEELANQYGWISDSDMCRKLQTLSVETIEELLKNFSLVTQPIIRGIKILDPSSADTRQTIFEYIPQDSDMIVDYLLMGSAAALKSAKYDCVVNCTTNIKPPDDINPECFIRLKWHDSSSQWVLGDALDATILKIEEWIVAKKIVLVHCEQGISRSGACILAYLMKTSHSEALSFEKTPEESSSSQRVALFDEAYKLLIEKRPIAKPNYGFRKQLRGLEM